MTRSMCSWLLLWVLAATPAMGQDQKPTSHPGMQKMRSLAGVWKGTVRNDYYQESVGVTLTYESVSGGQAVLERLKFGPSEEMVSIYHQEGDQMMTTHYCSSNTQPRLRTRSIPRDLSEFKFEFLDSTNILHANWMNITWLKLEFLPSGVLRQTWKAHDANEKAVVVEVRRATPEGRSLK